jgi:hypothetical protein
VRIGQHIALGALWCLAVGLTECPGYHGVPQDTGPILTTCEAAVALAVSRGCHGICGWDYVYCPTPLDCEACLSPGIPVALHCGGGHLSVRPADAGTCDVDGSTGLDGG